jgi:hypothetical protein
MRRRVICRTHARRLDDERPADAKSPSETASILSDAENTFVAPIGVRAERERVRLVNQRRRYLAPLVVMLLAGCSGGGAGVPTPPIATAAATSTPSAKPSATPKPTASAPASPSASTSPIATATPKPSGSPTIAPSTAPSATVPPSSASTGKIYYHFDPPITSTSGLLEDLNLAGDNYTDLIESNFVAGAMLARTVNETFPGVQFNKDYLYGTMFGQLLQENLETSLYTSSSNLIDPSSLQAAVMSVGQGGPYQINNYDVDLFAGGYTPAGYALLNYVAVQKNIGFTFSQAPAQFADPTPASFNNKYYGPMLTAYFHLNDLRSLYALGQTTYSPAPEFNACLNNLKTIPNAPLDVIVNYAYNQGYYGGLVAQSTAQCASNPSAWVAQANSYASASGSSYNAYPYQVRFYLDELYNQSPLVPQTANHDVMSVASLGTVFTNVMSTLSFANGGQSVYISSSTAQAAFSAAAQHEGASTTLDVSNPAQRAVLFAVLNQAIANVESSLNINFSQTTLTQL